ncbi:MAG: immunoglobulin domain-containing protein [Phycisphaerae bacterium]
MNSPRPLVNNAMAYDSRFQRIVMFGGGEHRTNGENGDTWIWNGANWTQSLVSPAPAHRLGHAMACDSRRQVIVLFGGFDSPYSFKKGDTWEWNGSAWAERAPAHAPSPRWGHAMTYDPLRQRVLLFGGFTDSTPAYNAETWEWDGVDWTQRSPPQHPSARIEHAMAYYPAQSAVVLFGGHTSAASLGDTWAWNGTTWTEIPVSGPSARYGHSLTYDSTRQRLVLFGGEDAAGLDGETWEWDPPASDWIRVSTTGPSPRTRHAAAFDAHIQRVVVYGGAPYNAGTDGCDETWLRGTSWSQVPRIAPAARYEHGLVYDPVRHVTLLFGGSGVNGDSDETWTWNGTTWTLRAPAHRPSARRYANMAFDTTRGVAVVAGGYGADANTWEWSGTDWIAAGANGTCANGGAAYFPTLGATWVYGGDRGSSLSDDTYRWDGTHWSYYPNGAPGELEGVRLAYHAPRDYMLLFGGLGGGYIWLDTYTARSPSNWVWRNAGGPPARTSHAMAHVASEAVTLMFGGSGVDGYLNDLWVWDCYGSEGWTQGTHATNPPAARFGHAMAYDSDRDVLVLFGGWNGARMSDTWEMALARTAHITTEPTPVSVCAGASASFTVVAAGTAPLSYQWRKGTTNLVNGGRISGAMSATLTINPVQSGDAATNYNCVVTNAAGSDTSIDVALAVSVAPAIIGQPTSRTVCTGGSTVFTITVTGSLPMTFDWRRNAVSFGASSTPNLQLNNITPAQAGNYDCVVSNACGSVTSNPAALTVNTVPVITAQPTNQAACVGGSVTFSVTATGGALLYQWRKEGSPISGATGPTYHIASALPGHGGNYRVWIANSCGNVESQVVTLRVPGVLGDLSLDGVVSSADLGIVLANWQSGSGGDINGDGATDSADLGILLGNWGLHCP